MKTKQDSETRAMMASAHNFLSNINSGQCSLWLLTFDDKRPVFLSSTKEKRTHAKRSKRENKNSNSCYENETRLGTTISKAKTNPPNLLLPNKELVFLPCSNAFAWKYLESTTKQQSLAQRPERLHR